MMAGYSVDGDFNPGNYDNKVRIWLSQDSLWVRCRHPGLERAFDYAKEELAALEAHHKDKWSSIHFYATKYLVAQEVFL